ncbi:MAG: serine/threonine-protein kinase [Myxococcota bacterium]|nr:serine/threonine-protein kinase [Myxococcota bacterium]
MSETFGQYQLIRKIAHGGMAEVFLASRQGEIGGFTKQVAIKRIYQHLAEDPELITMFFDEARIAAQLNHPNIVQIYDLGQIDGFFYIAMEFIHGRDVRSICERGIQVSNFLPIPTAVKLVAESAAGLHYAHTRADNSGTPLNIVHRDVSPQNILVAMNGGVKVCDFGIAKAEERLTHTRTGQFKGKFAYMSPEQVIGDGRAIDLRSDIFSLGIVLYEITVCTRLFRGKNDYDTIRMVAESDVKLPTQVRANFPPELERIIMKSLSREPSQRYQTAEEMQVELEEWLLEQRAKTSPVHIARYMAQIFPEMVEKPGGISEDMTVERDISDLVASGSFPTNLGANAEPQEPHTAIATAPSSPSSLQAVVSKPAPAPAYEAEDEWDDMDATGQVNISNFQQALQRDKVSVDESSFPSGQQEYTPTPRERHMTPIAQQSSFQGIAEQRQPASISASWSSEPAPAAQSQQQNQLANQRTSGSYPNANAAWNPQQQQPQSNAQPLPNLSGIGQGAQGQQWSSQAANPVQQQAPQPQIQRPLEASQSTALQGSGVSRPSGQWNAADPSVEAQSVSQQNQWQQQQHAQQFQAPPPQQQDYYPQQEPQQNVQWPSAGPPAPVTGPQPAIQQQPQAQPQPGYAPQQQGYPRQQPAYHAAHEPTPQSAAPAQSTDFEPMATSASMSYDIKALQAKSRNKKIFILLGGLVVVGVIAAVVITVGIDRPVPEIEDPNKIDPDKLKVEPPKPLPRIAVELATKPEGARVVINGVLVEGTTPGTFELAEGKTNEVLFYHPDHDPFFAIMGGTAGEVPEDAVELPAKAEVAEEKQGTIVVESEPLGGIVFHNGEQVGTAPQTLRNLNPEVEHHILVKNKGYYGYAALVRPIAGEEQTIRALLDPESQESRKFTVDLSLETMPRGAQAKANDEFAGVTPALKPYDRHKHVEVTFEAANYKPLTRRLETRGGVGTIVIRPALESLTREKGKITILLPKNTQNVYIGNNQYDIKSTKKLEMTEGKHTAVLEVEGGKRFEGDFEVIPGKHTRYKAEVLNGSLRLRKVK